MPVVPNRLALRVAVPLLVLAAVALAVAALVSGGSGGVHVATATAKPLVDPQGTPAKVPHKPYVVLIVMDEFPGDALRDAHGLIDPVRYPNIAALAANGTWYRNAWSKYDSTTKAVPLILDGMAPRPGTRQTYRDHPHSIFELFGRRGYRIVTSEEATAMCAPRWCARRERHPAGDRPAPARRAARALRALRPQHSPRPADVLVQARAAAAQAVPLPPSGHRTRTGGGDPLRGMDTVPGFYDEFVSRHNEQRFLLQLGFTDRLLGRLFARLKQQGMFDKTLIAITADHGLDWHVGVPTRRSVDARNVAEIARCH